MFDTSLITESRRASALKKDLTPLRIDQTDSAAVFPGSDGNMYETTLDACSCPDFAIQGFSQPCKHMIRLAMEMNMISSDGMQSDLEAARGKYYSGLAKRIVKQSEIDQFIPFAIYFTRLATYDRSVPDNAFKNTLDVETVSDIPFFKFKKNGTASIKKEWKKDVDSILTAIETRFGREMLDYANYDEKFLGMIFKEGE